MKDGYTRAEDERIIIQDIVCLPPAPIENEDIPKGEYGNAAADVTTQIERIYTTLEKLINMAAEEHVTKNCNENNKLKPECQNNITRFLTSEFLFCTLKPLTIQEFSQLQSNIAMLAAKQPENLHLILGSFAVRNAKDVIMSVVPHIQCGSKVEIDLIVKNYFADGDPIYKEKKNDESIKLKNAVIQVKQGDVGKDDKHDKLKGKKATILGKKCAFSFNNVLTCTTAGGARFFSCVDICLDHQRRIAKTRFENKLHKKLKNPFFRSALPLHCSHILISNTCNMLPSKCLVDKITHVDPFYSHKALEEDSEKPMKELKLPFCPAVKFYVIKPMICQLLQESEIKNKIQKHNETAGSFSFIPIKLRKDKKKRKPNALLQPISLSQSSISENATHLNSISEEDYTLPSTFLADFKEAKRTLEKETALQEQEDKIELNSSLLSASLLQFTQKEESEERASNTSMQKEAALQNEEDKTESSSVSLLQFTKKEESEEITSDTSMQKEATLQNEEDKTELGSSSSFS